MLTVSEYSIYGNYIETTVTVPRAKSYRGDAKSYHSRNVLAQNLTAAAGAVVELVFRQTFRNAFLSAFLRPIPPTHAVRAAPGWACTSAGRSWNACRAP
jgi:hypothetical protein